MNRKRDRNQPRLWDTEDLPLFSGAPALAVNDGAYEVATVAEVAPQLALPEAEEHRQTWTDPGVWCALCEATEPHTLGAHNAAVADGRRVMARAALRERRDSLKREHDAARENPPNLRDYHPDRERFEADTRAHWEHLDAMWAEVERLTREMGAIR